MLWGIDGWLYWTGSIRMLWGIDGWLYWTGSIRMLWGIDGWLYWTGSIRMGMAVLDRWLHFAPYPTLWHTS